MPEDGSGARYFSPDRRRAIAETIGIADAENHDALLREVEVAVHWFLKWSRASGSDPDTDGRQTKMFATLATKLQAILGAINHMHPFVNDRLAFAALDVLEVKDGLKIRWGHTPRSGEFADVYVDVTPLETALSGTRTLCAILDMAAKNASGRARKGNRADMPRVWLLGSLRDIHVRHTKRKDRERTFRPFVRAILRALRVDLSAAALDSALRDRRKHRGQI